MTEVELEKELIDVLKAAEPQSHWFKLEDRNRPGAWDQCYCIRGKEGWIEFKRHVPGKKITLRPKQYQWGRDGLKAGRRLSIIIFTPSVEGKYKYHYLPGDVIAYNTLKKWEEWRMAIELKGFSYENMENPHSFDIQSLLGLLRGEV